MTDPVGHRETVVFNQELRDALCRAFLRNADNGDNAANSELIHELRAAIHVVQLAKIEAGKDEEPHACRHDDEVAPSE